MKKYWVLTVFLAVLFCFSGCQKEPEQGSEASEISSQADSEDISSSQPPVDEPKGIEDIIWKTEMFEFVVFGDYHISEAPLLKIELTIPDYYIRNYDSSFQDANSEYRLITEAHENPSQEFMTQESSFSPDSIDNLYLNVTLEVDGYPARIMAFSSDMYDWYEEGFSMYPDGYEIYLMYQLEVLDGKNSIFVSQWVDEFNDYNTEMFQRIFNSFVLKE